MACTSEVDCVEQGPDVLELNCDYLVIGAGARGLAFVDAVLERAKACERKVRIAIVDERNEPGGQWNDAYRFARLHRESAHYGVSSRQLEKPEGARGVPYASPNEILTYYSDVMDDFVESGCVEFFPMCTFRDNRVASLMDSSKAWEVPPECKIVETTYARVLVPSMRRPPFEIGIRTLVVPPDYLPSAARGTNRYCVIGAGRTAIDAVLWLLARGLPPDNIRWVVPRDHWFLRRESTAGKQSLASAMAFCGEGVKAESVSELCEGLEKAGIFCRLDPGRMPECFHGTAVSEEELKRLRSIDDVVRLGHVQAVYENHLVLDHGVLPVTCGTVHVDCASSWIRAAEDPIPIWEGRRIILQPVQEVFVGPGEFNVATSAALVGLVEVLIADESSKNAMCTPGRHPDTVQDWLRLQACARSSKGIWTNPDIQEWLLSSRLSQWSAVDTKELDVFKNSWQEQDIPDKLTMLMLEEEEEAYVSEMLSPLAANWAATLQKQDTAPSDAQVPFAEPSTGPLTPRGFGSESPP